VVERNGYDFTPGVNFINIFKYEFFVRIFRTNIISEAFTTYMQLEKAAKTTFERKIRMFNVDEIDT